MAKLSYRLLGKDIQKEIDKNPFLIGRQGDNNLLLSDVQVSRYHTMIFRYENGLYIIDHSVNGTYFSPKDKSRSGPERLSSSLDSKAFIEFKSQQSIRAGAQAESSEKESLPKIPGFKQHKFQIKEDIQYLIEMVAVPEQARELLTGGGRRLVHEDVFYIPCKEQTDPSKTIEFLFIDTSFNPGASS